MRCDAKMVFIRVDLPKPVCPDCEYFVRKRDTTMATGLDLPTQMTLNWKPRFRSLRSIWVVMLSKPTWLFGMTGFDWVDMTLAVAISSHGFTKSFCVYCQRPSFAFNWVGSLVIVAGYRGSRASRRQRFRKRGLARDLRRLGLATIQTWASPSYENTSALSDNNTVPIRGKDGPPTDHTA